MIDPINNPARHSPVCHKSKTSLPLALVLTNTAFNDLFDLWVIHFVKAGWFYALHKEAGNCFQHGSRITFK